MTIDEIKNASIDELNARKNEIIAHKDDKSASLDDLKAWANELSDIDNAIKAFEARERIETFSAVKAFGVPVDGFQPTDKKSLGADSVEYKNAWLKNHAVVNQNGAVVKMFGEPNDVEQKAYTHTTTNTGEVVPTIILNRIADLVGGEAPMYEDATKTGMEQGFALPRLKEIVAGDAAVTEEGVANEDEENDFDQLELSGVEIKKHVEITQKLKWTSIEAFENWLVTHLAARILVAKERHIRSRLDSTTYGIDANNVKTGLAYTDDNILMLFGLLRGKGEKRIYMNNNTLYNFFAKIRNLDGDKIFVPSSNNDPAEGRIYGAVVRKDDDIPDHVVYVGYKDKLLANDFVELLFNNFTDPKSWKEIISAFSLFDAGLEDPKAFAKATFDPDAAVEYGNAFDLQALIDAAVAEKIAELNPAG